MYKPSIVQAEYFPDTRSSGVTVGQLASGTSWAASDMGQRPLLGDEIVVRLRRRSASDGVALVGGPEVVEGHECVESR
jgi:hypothetical protein